MPGSNSIIFSSGVAGVYSSQVGLIVRRLDTRNGLKYCFQLFAQSSSLTSLTEIVASPGFILNSFNSSVRSFTSVMTASISVPSGKYPLILASPSGISFGGISNHWPSDVSLGLLLSTCSSMVTPPAPASCIKFEIISTASSVVCIVISFHIIVSFPP
ncbi:hypothetical protein D3C73_1102850 [compost metagenome]